MTGLCKNANFGFKPKAYVCTLSPSWTFNLRLCCGLCLPKTLQSRYAMLLCLTCAFPVVLLLALVRIIYRLLLDLPQLDSWCCLSMRKIQLLLATVNVNCISAPLWKAAKNHRPTGPQAAAACLAACVNHQRRTCC